MKQYNIYFSGEFLTGITNVNGQSLLNRYYYFGNAKCNTNEANKKPNVQNGVNEMVKVGIASSGDEFFEDENQAKQLFNLIGDAYKVKVISFNFVDVKKE